MARPEEHIRQDRTAEHPEEDRRSETVTAGDGLPMGGRVELSVTPLEREGVIFRRNADGSLTLLARGELALTIYPPADTAPDAPGSSETAVRAPEGSSVPEPAEGAREPNPHPPARVPERAPGKERPRPQDFSGKVGSQPTVGTGRNGEPFVRFAFAEHPDEATTIWHKVVATKRHAERIAKHDLAVGDDCTVVGYPSVTQEQARGGKTRSVNLIRAVGIKVRRGPTPRENPQSGE